MQTRNGRGGAGAASADAGRWPGRRTERRDRPTGDESMGDGSTGNETGPQEMSPQEMRRVHGRQDRWAHGRWVHGRQAHGRQAHGRQDGPGDSVLTAASGRDRISNTACAPTVCSASEKHPRRFQLAVCSCTCCADRRRTSDTQCSSLGPATEPSGLWTSQTPRVAVWAVMMPHPSELNDGGRTGLGPCVELGKGEASLLAA